MIKVLLTGGGSGGHVYPLLSVLEELSSMRDQEFRVFYMGPKSPYDREFLERDVTLLPVLSSKMRRYFSPLNLLDIPKFFISIIQALAKMFQIMPDVVFSKGGPGALPVVIAAKFYFIPVIVHESDAVPGLTNKLSGKLADRVAVSFSAAESFFPKKKTAVVGNPVRKSLFEGGFTREHSKQHFGFDTALPALFFFGGSQGAQEINNFVLNNLAEFLGEFQILHIAGERNFPETEAVSKVALEELPEDRRRRYRVYPYLDIADLRFAYASADLVVARAGSGSIFELAAFGRASLLIPLSNSANGHQERNAWEYAKGGAGIVIESENFKPHIVLMKAREIAGNEAVRKKMEEAARAFARPGAAKVLAEEIARIGGGA
jgi:UDP-N-acetylglucosamine--N-acetylmuramyl-(pentapeptide) pyrophosphoryl-undecaprenol N-acetylglucosamine transferase